MDYLITNKQDEDENVNIKKPILILALISFLQYLPTLFFGITYLDDYQFILRFHNYNQNIENLFTSFTRGVFDNKNSIYYRPIFLDSILFNYQLCGENFMGYHLINILLHVLAVIILYKLLIKLKVKSVQAFILALLFAVHPALAEAVAWIPGRNDTLLAIFIFSFLIQSIKFNETGKYIHVILSCLFLLVSFYTKETTFFAIPVGFFIIHIARTEKWKTKNNLLLDFSWIFCFLIWFLSWSFASIKHISLTPKIIAYQLFHKIPVVIQYIGKIFIPINLSVYPTQKDTVYYLGYLSIFLILLIILKSKKKNWNVIFYSIVIFLFFLIPSLLIPNANENSQYLEHRLYLPFLGILLLLPQTILFKNKIKEKQLLSIFGIIAVILSAINFSYQQNFSSPNTFWTNAVTTSPNSCSANMMLAVHTKNKEKCEPLFQKAFLLNPKQKYLNFCYGVYLQQKDSILSSEKYFVEELKLSNYYQSNFYLARIAIKKNDLNAACDFLNSYLKNNPHFEIEKNCSLIIDTTLLQPKKMPEKISKLKELNNPFIDNILMQLGL